LFLLVPGVTLLTVLHPIGVILPASLLLLIASWHRNLVERDRLLDAEARRTEHRQRLEALIAELSMANEELTQVSRLKDEFLASMSHELRTPLNVVIGMAEILGEQVYGPLTERQQESVAMIESSGQHLLDLINDILDLSKIGAGKLVLDMGPVSIPVLCQASLRLIRQPAHKKHITVESQFDPAVETILADQRRLKQILINLLSNAVKFTPNDGKIGLEVIGDAEKHTVHFIVWDSGIGIAQENMGRLFRPFVQLDSSLSRQYDGTGLGLSLVYRLTEIQGGSVSVESTVGQGSRFTVSLPWQVVEPGQESGDGQEPAKPRAATGPLPPLRYPPPLILVADDNEASLKTLSDYLRAKRYQIRGAKNGHEALALANEHTPSLILMDIQMPGMDGLEAIRHIRAHPKLSHVPIIALTALAMPGDAERCMAAGANAYVSKPVRFGGLVEMIEGHLQAKE
jgi:signal transduction histidine kinase